MPDGADHYHPRFDWGLDNPGATPRGTPGTEEGYGGDLAWTAAPESSHIWGFRYYDVRRYSFLRKFPGRISQGRSELHVVFKDEKTGGRSMPYAYYFDNPDEGQAIADEMAASPHPYGEVLYPKVIQGKVPYTKLQ